MKKGQVKTFNKFLTLSTYHKFSEAIDFPGNFVILATPSGNVEQSTGRILRGKHKDVRPVIIDIFDNYSLFITMNRNRTRYYYSKGYEVLSFCDV